jgi:AcrR family transcriptional regulator
MSMKHQMPIQEPEPTNTSCIAGVRQPRQARGERRVDAILDACAALLTELGPDRLTVQALSERACASKGTLSHFFPDLPSVLRALADRHMAELDRLTRDLVADTTIDWPALSRAQTVDRFLTPLGYIKAHPDLLALARARVDLGPDARCLTPFRDLAEHILRHRCPSLPDAKRRTYASVMVGLADGVVGYALRLDDVAPREMSVELHRALVAYLGEIEAGAKSAAPERAD